MNIFGGKSGIVQCEGYINTEYNSRLKVRLKLGGSSFKARILETYTIMIYPDS